jgi:hypothetical protein
MIIFAAAINLYRFLLSYACLTFIDYKYGGISAQELFRTFFSCASFLSSLIFAQS